MRYHEHENQNSLRAYPFTDDSAFADTRAGKDPMPLDLIVSIRSTAAVTMEAALSGTRLIRVVVSQRFSSVVLETGEVMRLEGVPEPGIPYPLTKLSAFGVEQVCGHVVFGPGVDEGDWAPASAKLLPANYVYVPASGFTLSVSGGITARYVDDARILLRAPTRSGVELPAGYGIPATGEDLYLNTPAIVLEAPTAPQPACSAESPADCKGAILTVNGVPVPEDGNVEIDSIDPAGVYGDSVPGDSVPGPIDFSAYPEPGDSLPADTLEPPTVLVDMPVTVAANCGAALGDTSQARLPVAIRVYATTSEIVVHAAVVNDSGYRAAPAFQLTVMADLGATSLLAPGTWEIKTAPPRGDAPVSGGWATGPIPRALTRTTDPQGAVTDPVRYQNLNAVAPPYPSGIPGFSLNFFSPTGWADDDVPWKDIPFVVNMRESQGMEPPYFEALEPGEILTVAYLFTTAAVVEGDKLTVTVAASAHLLTGYGDVAGSSRGAASKVATVGGSPLFDRDAGPSDVSADLLPEYQT